MSNDQMINYHRIREDVLPPSQNTIIFSENRRVYENMVDNFNNGDLELKIKILKELKTYFKDP